MLYAIYQGTRIGAIPQARANCPNCQEEVIAKCGSINTWHWSHRAVDRCDAWGETETEWHLEWKKVMPPELTEIPIIKNGQRHIADIVRRNNWVVELQHSPISPEEIREREKFYDRMFWLFDIRSCRDNEGHWEGGYKVTEDFYYPRRLIHEHRFSISSKGDYWTFEWKHPRKHIVTAKNIFLDIGCGIFQVKKTHTCATPYRGWGYLWETKGFKNWLIT